MNKKAIVVVSMGLCLALALTGCASGGATGSLGDSILTVEQQDGEEIPQETLPEETPSAEEPSQPARPEAPFRPGENVLNSQAFRELYRGLVEEYAAKYQALANEMEEALDAAVSGALADTEYAQLTAAYREKVAALEQLVKDFYDNEEYLAAAAELRGYAEQLGSFAEGSEEYAAALAGLNSAWEKISGLFDASNQAFVQLRGEADALLAQIRQILKDNAEAIRGSVRAVYAEYAEKAAAVKQDFANEVGVLIKSLREAGENTGEEAA